jgi:hypothetical protein
MHRGVGNLMRNQNSIEIKPHACRSQRCGKKGKKEENRFPVEPYAMPPIPAELIIVFLI